MDDLLKRILDLMGNKHGAGKELALHLGIHPSVITDWKAGRNKAYRKYVAQIAEYYGVSVDWLTGLSDEKDPKKKPLINGDEELTEYLEQLRTRPEMRMLFSISKNATKEDVERAVAIIEAQRKTEENKDR